MQMQRQLLFSKEWISLNSDSIFTALQLLKTTLMLTPELLCLMIDFMSLQKRSIVLCLPVETFCDLIHGLTTELNKHRFWS